MGADIEEKEDGLIVRSSKLKGAPLHSYHDHRMVMSLCVAALGAEGASTIQDIECVAKTYPNFKQHMVSLGANIE
jgi:3-phosphoshikimate 1-carboxyvinyltransferase